MDGNQRKAFQPCEFALSFAVELLISALIDVFWLPMLLWDRCGCVTVLRSLGHLPQTETFCDADQDSLKAIDLRAHTETQCAKYQRDSV